MMEKYLAQCFSTVYLKYLKSHLLTGGRRRNVSKREQERMFYLNKHSTRTEKKKEIIKTWRSTSNQLVFPSFIKITTSEIPKAVCLLQIFPYHLCQYRMGEENQSIPLKPFSVFLKDNRKEY